VLEDDKKEVSRKIAKNYVKEKYSWEKIAKRYYNELNKIVSKSLSL